MEHKEQQSVHISGKMKRSCCASCWWGRDEQHSHVHSSLSFPDWQESWTDTADLGKDCAPKLHQCVELSVP